MAAQASTEKGWVRDGILSSLSKGPRNSTQMARELGVSKATVSYHTKSLVSKGIIEISDVRSIRGGVYSKMFALRQERPVLARRAADQDTSVAELDDLFERFLMNWHINPERAPADDAKIFLYHAYRLLARAGALEPRIFEQFGTRVGEEMVSSSLRFGTLKDGLKELVAYLGEKKMADMRLDYGKSEARLACSSCFENTQHGSLVCDFTKGIIEGTLKEKRGKSIVQRTVDSEIPACVFTVRWGRLSK